MQETILLLKMVSFYYIFFSLYMYISVHYDFVTLCTYVSIMRYSLFEEASSTRIICCKNLQSDLLMTLCRVLSNALTASL